MALMLIESTDPKLSFHLRKNPNSGAVMKSLRSGTVTGWYPHGDPQKYAMWFHETGKENSFSNEDGRNYLDLTKYASTYFVFNAITTLFNNVLKLNPDQKYQHNHKVTIPMVQLRTRKTLDHLSQFTKLDVNAECLTENEGRMSLYKITLEYKGSFNEFMMRVYLLFYLMHADLYQSDIVWMEGMIAKVVGIMTELQCDYFLWYWFKKNVLIKHKFYAELEDKLGKNSVSGEIQMQYGDTQTQRKNFVDKYIDFKLPIIDFGCGEGDYLLPYAKKVKNAGTKITGVEIDEKLVNGIQRKLEDRKLDDVAKVVNSLDEIPKEVSDIICIEVIEHMPMEDAQALIVNLLKRRFRHLIISTPNIEFNQFYTTMPTRFRHDDHHFELNQNQFKEMILTAIDQVWDENRDTLSEWFTGVGDRVNGIPMAQAVIITNRDYI